LRYPGEGDPVSSKIVKIPRRILDNPNEVAVDVRLSGLSEDDRVVFESGGDSMKGAISVPII